MHIKMRGLEDFVNIKASSDFNAKLLILELHGHKNHQQKLNEPVKFLLILRLE